MDEYELRHEQLFLPFQNCEYDYSFALDVCDVVVVDLHIVDKHLYFRVYAYLDVD